MRFRQKMLLVMVWLLTLSYGVGGVFLIRQNFKSTLSQIKKNNEESYEMILQSVQLVNFVDIQQDFSSISNTLEKMNTSDSIVGIKLMKGDTVLYQTGETITDYDGTEEFELLMFSRDARYFYQIRGSVNTDSMPLQLIILYDITPVYAARDEQVRT